MNLCATCGHRETDHAETLYGVVCHGAIPQDWWEANKKQKCPCTQFVKREERK